MRAIERSTRFKRDYKRELKGQHRATLDADLMPVLVALASDAPLDPRYQDHGLSGLSRLPRQARPRADLCQTGRDDVAPGPARIAERGLRRTRRLVEAR